MLPMYPESIVKVFLGSLRAYKKFFIPLMPIAILLGFADIPVLLLSDYFQISQVAWLGLSFNILMALVSMFCSFWAISYVYDILVNHEASYKASLKTVSKRFFKASVPFFLSFLIGVVVLAINYYLTTFFASGFLVDNKVIGTLIAIIFILIAPSFFAFFTVYILDVLVMNTKVLPTIKKAAKIAVRGEIIWRAVCFLMLYILVNLMFVALVFVLSFINIALKSLVPDTVIVILAILLIFPLNLILLINFYNDLMLRFKKRA